MNRAERRQQERQARRALSPKQRAHLQRTAAAILRQGAIFRALDAHEEFSAEEQMRFTLPLRMALERMKAGAGNDSDFHELACAVNILIVCSESISQAVEQAANEAAEALMRSLARDQRHGRHGLDGPGMLALAQALDLYEQLTSLVTKQQFRTAVQEAIRRMDAGHVIEIA